jgi:hypothetical protein
MVWQLKFRRSSAGLNTAGGGEATAEGSDDPENVNLTRLGMSFEGGAYSERSIGSAKQSHTSKSVSDCSART